MMNHRISFFAVLFLSLLFTACWERKEKPVVETPYQPVISDVQGEVRDSILVGHLGEETAMGSFQLITDNGDTLSITRTSADGVEGIMLGEIRNYEDRVMMSVKFDDENNIFLNTFLNVSQLEDVWTSDASMLNLLPDSSVQSQGYNYTHWRVERCKLLLVGESQTEYGVHQPIDTATIDRLDADSLHLSVHRHGKIKLGRKL